MMGGFVDIFRRVWNWLSSPVVGPDSTPPIFLCKLDFTHASPGLCCTVDFAVADFTFTYRVDFTHEHPSTINFIKGRE